MIAVKAGDRTQVEMELVWKRILQAVPRLDAQHAAGFVKAFLRRRLGTGAIRGHDQGHDPVEPFDARMRGFPVVSSVLLDAHVAGHPAEHRLRRAQGEADERLGRRGQAASGARQPMKAKEMIAAAGGYQPSWRG